MNIIYVSKFTFIHIFCIIRFFISMHIICMHVYVCVGVSAVCWVFARICMCVHVCTGYLVCCICLYVCECVCVCVCTYIYIYIYIHMHVYVCGVLGGRCVCACACGVCAGIRCIVDALAHICICMYIYMDMAVTSCQFFLCGLCVCGALR